MDRAQLYLSSVLRTLEHVDSSVLADLAEQAGTDASIVEPELRKADMKAAVGVWSERTDLPDSRVYIADLRNVFREIKLITA